MKIYADTATRRTRQLLSDLFVLLWIATWVWAGRQVHDVVARLGTPADSITSAGQSVEDSLSGAGEQAGRIPAVGDDLQGWLDQAAGSGTTLKNAGLSMSSTIDTLATVLGWLTAVLPIVLAVGVWAWVRWRFIRQATSAQRFIDAGEDLDLFALRAMTNQPMTALARISDDPAGAWRRRDPEVIRALATLELREQGLRPPARLTGAAGPGPSARTGGVSRRA